MAQFPGLTLPPSGGNQTATLIQGIVPVKVTIVFSKNSESWGHYFYEVKDDAAARSRQTEEARVSRVVDL